MRTDGSRKRKRRRRGQGRRAYLSVSVIVLILSVILSAHCYSLYHKNEAYKAQIASLEQQKEQETEKQSEIQQYRDYVSSDAFTIEVARQKLGLVFPGETIFRSADQEKK